MKNKTKLIVATTIVALSGIKCSNQNNDNKINAQDLNNYASHTEQTDNQINQIDEYVDYIRQNGDNFNITHKKIDTPFGAKAVVCQLDGQTVKMSIIADSTMVDIADVYVKDSMPVLLVKNKMYDDVDEYSSENVYYIDGKVYKCFRGGLEITDSQTIADISDLSFFYKAGL